MSNIKDEINKVNIPDVEAPKDENGALDDSKLEDVSGGGYYGYGSGSDGV